MHHFRLIIKHLLGSCGKRHPLPTSSFPTASRIDDLLAIKRHRPLTYHTIVHIAIGKKETMTMQSCKLHKQISDQYLVSRLTCTLLIVFLNNNKLLKLTIDGGKLFYKPATRCAVNNDVSHSYDLCSKRSCKGLPLVGTILFHNLKNFDVCASTSLKMILYVRTKYSATPVKKS